ncbi:MAG: hypothetical protein KGO94_07195 [Alphaproteobacteria bacterium]|nr:hypothetical protein [Alphaproteobacteria bacterium]
MIKTIMYTTVALAVLANSANAAGSIAQISELYGKVLVGQGKGYLKPRNGMMLQTGDKIYIGQNSSVTVVYSDNCTVNYTAPAVINVANREDIQCQSTAPIQQIQAPPQSLPTVPAPAVDMLPLALGGAAVLAGGAAVLFLTKKSDPVSAPAP